MNGYRQAAVLGLDLGTSSVKVLLTALDGRVLGRASAGYPVHEPAPGRAEADPWDWWTAACRAVPAALAEAAEARPAVTALAVTGQSQGIVLADDRGAALRPAILGLDQRATAETALYRELPWDYAAPLGNSPAAGLAGPLLCWLAAHEPHTLACSWWALQPKDWLRLRLTGQAATEPTGACATLLFDLTRDTWADPLIDKLGLPRDKLPPVQRPAETAGRLLPGPAAELGLAPGIPVAAGAGDTAAALHAARLHPDEALLLLGRDGQWLLPVPSPAGESQAGAFPSALPGPLLDPAAVSARTNLYRAVGDGYYRLAQLRDVGVTLDQVRNRSGATWNELYATASRPRRPSITRFAPGLTPERDSAGARPARPANARAREDRLRGALDDAAAQLRQRLDDLRADGHAPRRVVLAGAGPAHPAWRALLAEAFALPVTPAADPWLAAAGAARLAAGLAETAEARWRSS